MICRSIPTNHGKCPACGQLLTGVYPLCYTTVEDYNRDHPGPGPMPVDKAGNPIPVCPTCGKPNRDSPPLRPAPGRRDPDGRKA